MGFGLWGMYLEVHNYSLLGEGGVGTLGWEVSPVTRPSPDENTCHTPLSR